MIDKLLKKYLTPRRIEIGLYLVCGLSAAIVNFGLFAFLIFLSVDYRIANIFALVFTKLFAFLTNKLLVFKSRSSNFKELTAEFARFFSGRIFTGVLDYFGVIMLVEVFLMPQNGSKFALQVIVIILNYVFAKASFKKKA